MTCFIKTNQKCPYKKGMICKETTTCEPCQIHKDYIEESLDYNILIFDSILNQNV